jgi:hypothetical protein
MKKTYKIILTVTSNNPDLPDWGLGKGVLATQEVIYDADKASDIMIAANLNAQADELIKNTINITYQEL